VRIASDLLANVTGTRILVVLDEFDRCESGEFRRNIAELLKNLSDRSVRVQLVIAGVAANLTELVEHIPSIQRNVFALEVPKMTASEIRHLVRNGEESSGLTFDDAATECIVSLANGTPYLASLLSHHAGLAALDAGRLAVTTQDVAIALSDALDELRGRISKRAQAQIAAGAAKGIHRTLGPLSGAVQSSGGEFQLEDINAAYPNAVAAAQCRTLVELLAAEGVLLEADQRGSGLYYRFLEESVPAYVWLLAGQARLFAAERAAPAQDAVGATAGAAP
jgi:hypothetical protein